MINGDCTLQISATAISTSKLNFINIFNPVIFWNGVTMEQIYKDSKVYGCVSSASGINLAAVY